MTTEIIDCRKGLTLHSGVDNDWYSFTVESDDLDSSYNGISVQFTADFALTASLYRDGVLVKSGNGKSFDLAIKDALPGDYTLKISGGPNAYTMRARIYDPKGRVRAFELEDWLDSVTLIDPGDFLPQCGGGCPPFPDWMQALPFEDTVFLALEANDIILVQDDFVQSGLILDGTPTYFNLVTAETGNLNLQLELDLPLSGTQATAGQEGLYASIIDNQGTELWRVEGRTGTIQHTIEIEGEQSYLLTVNGLTGSLATVTLRFGGEVEIYLPFVVKSTAASAATASAHDKIPAERVDHAPAGILDF